MSFTERSFPVKKRRGWLWVFGVIGMEGLIWYYNSAPAWQGGTAKTISALASFGYALFWAIFTACSNGRKGMLRTALIFSVIHLFSSVGALLANGGPAASIGFLVEILTFFHAGVTFYGFRAWLGWEGAYAVGVFLSAAWMAWCLLLGKQTNFSGLE